MAEQMVVFDDGDEGRVQAQELGDEVLDRGEGIRVAPLSRAALFVLFHHRDDLDDCGGEEKQCVDGEDRLDCLE